MLTAGHPDDDLLEKYALDHLSEVEAGKLEEHIMLCAPCQDRLAFTDSFVRTMKKALAPPEKAATAGGAWRSRIGGWFQMPAPVWAGVAAALVLGVGGLVGTRYFAPAGPPVAIALSATRGESASAASTGPLDLKLDARDLAPAGNYRVEIVDAEGARVWEQAAPIQDGFVRVLVRKHFARGQYFVRLAAPAAGVPREYALQIR